MSKLRVISILCITVLVFMCCTCLSPTVHAGDMSAVTIDSMKVLLFIMGEATSNFEPSLTVVTTFSPTRSDMDIDRLIEYAQNVDAFTGSLLYRVQWLIEPYGDKYKAHFEFSYYITEDQYQEIQDFANTFVQTMDQTMSDYDKVKYTHDYLANNCTYDISKDGPYNCLIEKRSNCNGYALSFYLIMKKCGIPCNYVTGYDHAWNTVQLDSLWYNIDVTWDDSNDNLNYQFFLMGHGDWEGHDRNTATAGYQYCTYDQLRNWVNTIYYWGRFPFLLLFIIGVAIYFKKK